MKNAFDYDNKVCVLLESLKKKSIGY